MSYVLNEVLNNDIVDEINKLVVNDTIQKLKIELECAKATNAKLTFFNDVLTDDLDRARNRVGSLEEELKTYNIDVSEIAKKFDEELITEWDDEGGDTGKGISFNKNTYKDFDDWYNDYKSDFINWFCASYKWEYGNIPNLWVFQAMTYEKENYGDSFISQTENYTKFLGSVLYLRIYEYLGEYEDDDEDYSIPRRFKKYMKDLYDSKETDTDSDTASLDTDPNTDSDTD